MRENSYLKRKSKQMVTGNFSDAESLRPDEISKSVKKLSSVFLLIFFLFFSVAVLFFQNNIKRITTADKNQIQLMSTSIASTDVKRTIFEIPVGTVKTNPFLPYRDLDDGDDFDVYNIELTSPPEQSNKNSEAARIVRTVVSGVLYDKYSPSAILNIEGSDYLVKKGDVVNNYHVLNIARDSVTVKLGENVYKAGIGELLTEGVIHHNDVSNLNNKFGGENNGL